MSQNLFQFVNTIDAFEKDIHLQVDFLNLLKNKNRFQNSSKKYNLFWQWRFFGIFNAWLNLFRGLGTCNGSIRFVQNKHLVKSKHVYFVSISGNTITNIKIAKLQKNQLQ